MKKKPNAIFMVIGAILILMAVYKITDKRKGYELPSSGEDIRAISEYKDGSHKFHTLVKIQRDESVKIPIILELNLETELEWDKEVRQYVLKNPKLQVTPIGCYEYEKTPIIVRGTKCSQNYRVAANDDKTLITTMDIGCGKLLLQNTNIKINQVNPINSSSNVNSPKRLKKAKNDYEKIVLNYNTEGFSFDQWLNIEFKVISDKEGVFYVGY